MSSDPTTSNTYLRHLMVTRLMVTAGGSKDARYPYCLDGIPAEPRIFLLCSGEAMINFEGAERRIAAGATIFLPAWSHRKLFLRRKMSASWRVLSFTTVEPVFLESTSLMIRPKCNISMEAASFRRITSLIKMGDEISDLVAEGEMKALLARFIAGIESSQESRTASSNRSSSASVDAVIQYIVKNYKDVDLLENLHRVSKLSPNYFRDLFKKRMGITPGMYITKIRMRAARYYLLYSGMRVKEVAAAVGFNDQFYFSRIYHGYWGHSPSMEKGSE